MKKITRKIEMVDLMKKRIGNEHKLYVTYKGTEYILKSLDWEDAKKEATELLHKFNKQIIVD